MQATKLSCPDCNATLQTAKPIPAGAKIKCPKCGSSFASPGANGSPGAAKPTTKVAAAKTQPPSKKSRPVARDDDDDDDDDDIDDRPKKKKKFKNRKEASSSTGMILLIASLILLVVVGGGVGAYFIFSGDKKPDTAKNDGKDGTADKKSGDNSGTPRGKKPPSDDTDSTENNKKPTPPSGGSGTDLASLDVGNMAAKQANQLDGLKYLPADCITVAGLDAGDVLSNQVIASLLDSKMELGKNLQEWGLTPAQVDHLVVGCNLPLAQAIGKDTDSATGVVVIKTKAPYDAAKVKQAMKAGDAAVVPGKEIYKLTGKNVLYMPSNTLVIIAQLPEDKIAAFVGLNGEQPAYSADLGNTIAKIGPAHAWFAVSADQVAAMAGGITAPPGMPPQMQGMVRVLSDGMAKSKGGFVAARLQGNQLKLSGNVVCPDGGTSRQLSQGLGMFAQGGKAGLEAVKTFAPQLSGLLDDLGKVQFKSQGELAQATADVSFTSIDGAMKMSPSDWMNIAASAGGMAKQGGGGLAQTPGGGTPGGNTPGGGTPGGNTSGDGVAEGLQVGQRAPEISGKDIDGKEFKLSEYRGKVILLDFWGHW